MALIDPYQPNLISYVVLFIASLLDMEFKMQSSSSTHAGASQQWIYFPFSLSHFSLSLQYLSGFDVLLSFILSQPNSTST